MSVQNDSNTIRLFGEVVSLYEMDGIQYVKIHYDPGFVDVVFQELQDVFLSDRVVISSKLEVESISTSVDNNYNSKNEFDTKN